MSRSYRSEKESQIAKRNMPRDAEGSVILPRIIERKPREGDVHPLSKKQVARFLRDAPKQYIYGLTRIELRARQSEEIGDPFGLYMTDEKAIILYSLPLEWELRSISSWLKRSLTEYNYNVEISEHETHTTVRWPTPNEMWLWFYFEVFTHEIGHHFRTQYRHKRKAGTILDEEIAADLHAKRFTDRLLESNRKRKAEPGA